MFAAKPRTARHTRAHLSSLRPNCSPVGRTACASPVGLDNLLAITQGTLPVLHVQAHAHGLVTHVKHVYVAVLKYRAHLLLAQLADLQQLARGRCAVKERTGQPRAGKGRWEPGRGSGKVLPTPAPSLLAKYMGKEGVRISLGMHGSRVRSPGLESGACGLWPGNPTSSGQWCEPQSPSTLLPSSFLIPPR